jgi:hypothetical protein
MSNAGLNRSPTTNEEMVDIDQVEENIISSVFTDELFSKPIKLNYQKYKKLVKFIFYIVKQSIDWIFKQPPTDRKKYETDMETLINIDNRNQQCYRIARFCISLLLNVAYINDKKFYNALPKNIRKKYDKELKVFENKFVFFYNKTLYITSGILIGALMIMCILHFCKVINLFYYNQIVTDHHVNHNIMIPFPYINKETFIFFILGFISFIVICIGFIFRIFGGYYDFTLKNVDDFGGLCAY